MADCVQDTIKHHAFGTVVPTAGDTIVAEQQNDTINLTSTGGSISVTGAAGTDTLDLAVVPASAGINSFETINCPAGTNPVADSATDTLNLTSAHTGLTITGDGGTDTVDFDLVESNIDHDALNNFVANEHIDWTGAGAGTIHTDNYIEGGAGTDTTALHDNVANEITAITAKASAVAADEFVMEDSAASFVKKAITFADLEGSLTLGNLSGTLPIGSGGTASTTAQAAIDLLSAVSAATNEHVLTKDTGTGNAIWKVAAGGGDPDQNLYETFSGDTVSTTANTTTDTLTIAGGTGITTLGSTDQVLVSLDVPVSIANGGTNSTTALGAVAGRLMVSDGSGKIVETASITAVNNTLDEVGIIQSSSPDIAFNDQDGNVIFKISSNIIFTDVNYVTVGAASINNSPTIFMQGTDLNIGVLLQTKGNGDIGLQPDTGNVDVTQGNLIITSGRLDLTAGDVRFAAGNSIQVETTDVITLTSTSAISSNVAHTFDEDIVMTTAKSITMGGADFITPTASTLTLNQRTVLVDDLSFTSGKAIQVGATDLLTLATALVTHEVQARFDKSAYFETEIANTSSSGTAAINLTNGNKQKLTLSENTTITFTEPAGPLNVVLRIIQDTTARTVTWPADVKWPGGTAPVISTGSGAIDVVTLYYDGTDFYGGFLQDFS